MLLHLSDLHFGINASGESAHHFAKSRKPTPGVLAKTLLKHHPEPEAIIVSGDIGWSGSKDDYHYAAEFFSTIRKHWRVVELVIVPGNHDVDRNSLTTIDAQ